MKDTAIEWFFIQLTEIDYGCINKTFLQNDNTLAGYKLRELFEQAKEMFEKQIIEAWDKGDYCIDLPDGGWEQKYKSGEQYYKETFKSE